MASFFGFGFVALTAVEPATIAATLPSAPPLLRTVDLDRDESQEVALPNGTRVRVKLLDVEEVRDPLRSAVRQVRVKVEVNGQTTTLNSGNYNLPVSFAGVQIDCPVTRGYYPPRDPIEDPWGLEKDARLRLWPAGSPWTAPGTFVYPVRQRWFASATQMGNEPAYVDGGDAPTSRPIYYHNGLDIGVCEGLVEAVAAADGLVVSAGGERLLDYADIPFAPSRQAGYDSVYVIGDNGWFYRYAHLKTIDPAVRPGQRVKMGQTIALVGKEGGSGGWSHLHFDVKARQPSGKWGMQDGYAFLWEAYQREYHPNLIAVARPHRLARVGDTVVLDGSRSWSSAGQIASYDWTFGDGTTAQGPQVQRRYDKPGAYSEILKITGAQGRIDYDFAVVQVLEAGKTNQFPPTIHANYAPTFNIQVDAPVIFKVRTFRSSPGDEAWDFGDGSPNVTVHSDGNVDSLNPHGYAETIHRFAKAGHYVVRVEGKGRDGTKAVAHLQVRVDEKKTAQAPTQTPVWESWLSRKVLPEVEARWMMRGFLNQQLRPIPLPQTREAWTARRDALRHEVLKIVGLDDLVPAKWDLAVESKGTIRREGYRIEKVTFQSYPGLTIPAIVYVPEGITGRVPGMVSITGHTDISKAADYIQQRNVNLVRRGCVVLCYDYYGYGERKTGDHPDHPTGANGHDIRPFSYTQRCATSLEVLDAIRALDLLAARPEVDPERMGFTGESGGSNSSYWMAAVDSRVKLVVPVCSVTTYDYWIRTDVNWDWHQRPPGIRRIADIGTLLALHAPKPLLIISSRRGTDDEEFPLQEAEKSYQWAKHVYKLLGAEEAADHYESTTSHGYQEDKRARLYAAVERWLRPPFPKGDKELPTNIESVEELRCVLPAKNLTFRDIYAEWVKPLPRTNAASDSEALREFLRERLALPRPAPEVKAERIGQEEQGSWFAEFWLIEAEPGIRLPAVWIGKKGDDGPVTLVPGRDKQAVARALDAGRQVLAFDLRGTGEMRHGEGGSWPWMAGSPWPELFGEAGGRLSNWAWFAGRPWPGMWALDLHQAARFCRHQLGASTVAVDAQNHFGWSALLAAAADPGLIGSGAVQLRLASLHDDIRARGDAALADVPGLLEQLDIPQLRQLWPGGQVKIRTK